MALVDINVQDNGVMLARICYQTDSGYMVQFLEESKPGIFKFEKTKTEISNEEISGFYDTEDMSQAGYTDIGDGKYTQDDSDYNPSSEDESEDDISVCSED